MKEAINKINFIAIGVSAGGFEALNTLVTKMPAKFNIPIGIVQHRGIDSGAYLAKHLNNSSKINVKDVLDKEPIVAGSVYIAPPDYHLLVEREGYFSLSRDAKVNYSRPSIDVFFETVAEIYPKQCLAIILTGKNNDGAIGLAKVAASGGVAIVQDPKSAYALEMPMAAIKSVPSAITLSLSGIVEYLLSINHK